MAGSLVPQGYETLEDANGTTVPGGLIWTYAAGTTTPLATFSDAALTVPNANPIIADGSGRWVAYATQGTGFKLVFETPAIPPAHGATIKTCDPVVAPIIDATAAFTGGATVISDNSTGTINNFVLAGRTKDTLWVWNGSADLTVTGIAGGASGDRLQIKNMSTTANRKILLAHLNAGSANPFFNIATSAPTPIAPNGWATYVFVGGTWVLSDHQQGQVLSAPFNAANFVSGQGGPWTITAGNVTQFTYVLNGRMLTLTFAIENTTLGSGILNLYCINPAYGGFIGLNVANVYQNGWYNPNTSVFENIIVFLAPSLGSSDRVILERFNIGAFTAGIAFFYGTITFPVA